MFDNKSCLVKDTITNFTLDLSDFAIEKRTFNIPKTIELGFNLCNKLKEGCGTDRNASACFQRDGISHTLGESFLVVECAKLKTNTNISQQDPMENMSSK